MSSLQILFFSSLVKKSPLKNGCVKIKSNHGRSSIAFKHSAAMADVRPPVVSFKPSMWEDTFSTFSFDEKVQKKYFEEIEALKQEVRSMLVSATSTKLMVLIDELERLGLAYHFETEIKDKLNRFYTDEKDDNEDYDLFKTALRFRLLRQQQYHVSCNDFNKFVDKENKLKEAQYSDVPGLLSLYEAAHVRMHGERILDEALVFTSHHLNSMLPQLEVPLKEKVQHALEYPLHKSVTTLHIRSRILSYEEAESSDELLLRLAKLNFNYLRNIYKDELVHVSKWYKKFDLKSKLPYARDRLVECYMWSVAHKSEPQYSYVRMMLAKTYQMVTVMDDTYDNYATMEELEVFTQAIERWDVDKIDHLPDYLKQVYKFIMSISEEFGRNAEKAEKSYAIPYYIEAIKQLGRVYYEEQKWIRERKLPTFEEYTKISQVICLIFVLLISVIPGLKSTTEETIQWLLSDSQIVSSACLAGRLLNDLASYKRERRDGKMLTIVDCYMKDKGVTEEEALSAFVEIVDDQWKYVNAEWVKSRVVPNEMVEQIINMLRSAEMVYKNKEDGYSMPEGNSNSAPFISALLVDPPLLT